VKVVIVHACSLSFESVYPAQGPPYYENKG